MSFPPANSATPAGAAAELARWVKRVGLNVGLALGLDVTDGVRLLVALGVKVIDGVVVTVDDGVDVTDLVGEFVADDVDDGELVGDSVAVAEADAVNVEVGTTVLIVEARLVGAGVLTTVPVAVLEGVTEGFAARATVGGTNPATPEARNKMPMMATELASR